jgi:hypothetical protein
MRKSTLTSASSSGSHCFRSRPWLAAPRLSLDPTSLPSRQHRCATTIRNDMQEFDRGNALELNGGLHSSLAIPWSAPDPMHLPSRRRHQQPHAGVRRRPPQLTRCHHSAKEGRSLPALAHLRPLRGCRTTAVNALCRASCTKFVWYREKETHQIEKWRHMILMILQMEMHITQVIKAICVTWYMRCW